MEAVELLLRIGLTVTFLLSAAGKTMSLGKSAGMVAQLVGIGPGRLARTLAVLLILGEAGTALAIASADNGVRADLAGAGALILCAAFVWAATRASLSGRAITCHCFGNLRPARELGPRTLLRALPLAAAVVLWYLAMRQVSLDNAMVADRAAVSFATSALVATALAWVRWRHGVEHRRYATGAIQKQSAVRSMVDSRRLAEER